MPLLSRGAIVAKTAKTKRIVVTLDLNRDKRIKVSSISKVRFELEVDADKDNTDAVVEALHKMTFFR
jgi:hypothetical protein